MAEAQTVTKQGSFPDTRRDFIADGGWLSGCDSLLFPTDIAQGAYTWSVNCINRGGVIATRPPRSLVFILPGNRAQGMTQFVTLDQTQYIVWVIDGLVYQSVFPFKSYSQITGLQFSPFAPRVYFTSQVQAAKYSSPSLQSTIVFQTPVKYLFIQDGVSNPGWWDGTTASQPTFSPTDTTYTGVPIGTVMSESAGRIWVAVGRQVYASDFVIPTQFREQTYLAQKSGFQFPRNVSAMLQAPQDSGLFIFTDTGLYTLQSNIVDRTQWQTTPQFQSTVTEYVGSVSAFAPIYQHGLPWFYSAKGFLSIDMALQEHISNVLYPRDGEMTRSKARLFPDLSGVCTGSYENMLLVAVPHASRFNRHTWVMDGAVSPKLNGTSGSCWTGIWTGTYPVQFSSFVYRGIEHCYELSYMNGSVTTSSGSSHIAIWENFVPAAQSDGGSTPIRSQLETRMFAMPNADMMQLCFVEVYMTRLSGTVTLSFYFAGIAGLYNLLSTSTFRADQGPFFSASQPLIYYKFPGQNDSNLQSFRTQTRYARSSEADPSANPSSAHMIEVGQSDIIDRGFQLLFKWTGNMGVRLIKCWYRPYSTSSIGFLASDESRLSNVVLDAV